MKLFIALVLCFSATTAFAQEITPVVKVQESEYVTKVYQAPCGLYLERKPVRKALDRLEDIVRTEQPVRNGVKKAAKRVDQAAARVRSASKEVISNTVWTTRDLLSRLRSRSRVSLRSLRSRLFWR